MPINDSSNEQAFATCRCRNCDNSIEFPVDGSGQNIECPHCGMETQLVAQEGQKTPVAKCECDYCRGRIEFDPNEFSDDDSVVSCPHCGEQTKLKIQNEAPAMIAGNSGTTEDERSKQLQEIKDRLEKTAIILSKNDTLELAFDKIKIRRRGMANMLASGLNGERTILISAITGIQIKTGGLFSPGYILFSYAGSKPFPGGIIAATQDPDAFIFDQSLNEEVAEFKAKVEKIMQMQKKEAGQVNDSPSLPDELRKLAELKDQGILSPAEFEAAKKKLLK